MSRQTSANASTSLYDRSPLARARYAAGLTREQAAVEFGISFRQYQRIESGTSRPRPQLAEKIAKRLGSTIEELFL